MTTVPDIFAFLEVINGTVRSRFFGNFTTAGSGQIRNTFCPIATGFLGFRSTMQYHTGLVRIFRGENTGRESADHNTVSY